MDIILIVITNSMVVTFHHSSYITSPRNYKMKLDISKQIDFNRKSSTEMISEEK